MPFKTVEQAKAYYIANKERARAYYLANREYIRARNLERAREQREAAKENRPPKRKKRAKIETYVGLFPRRFRCALGTTYTDPTTDFEQARKWVRTELYQLSKDRDVTIERALIMDLGTTFAEICAEEVHRYEV